MNETQRIVGTMHAVATRLCSATRMPPKFNAALMRLIERLEARCAERECALTLRRFRVATYMSYECRTRTLSLGAVGESPKLITVGV